jgi:enoyl-CoA hydratase
MANAEGEMTVSIELTQDGGVAHVRFTTPWILDMPTRTAMADAFARFTTDDTVRAIVVSGGPEVFVKGDLAMIADKSPAELRALDLHRYWLPLIDCPKPVIAAVAGLAWGAGCELALMCDIIVADPTAQFAQPESRLGVMPGAGGAQRLIRALGRPMASYLLMTGDPLSGDRAYQLGLVCELVAAGTVEAAGLALAARLASQPPLSMANIKRALATGPDLPLADAATRDHETWLDMFATQDQKEGMAAALAGRPPSFRGR